MTTNTSTTTMMLLISTLAFASLVLASVEETESCTFQVIPPLGKACDLSTCVSECRKKNGDQQPGDCRPGAECITGDGVCVPEGCNCMVCNKSAVRVVSISATSAAAPAN